MKVDFPHYVTGQEVRAGDRVRYGEAMATVVIVSDGDSGEFAHGYEDYFGGQAGITLSNDDGELTFLAEPGEDLELICPAPAGH
jgi:hypothetical protein